MKKRLTLLVVLNCFWAHAQWNTFSHISGLDIQCINEQTIVMVGNGGFFAKTTDAGSHWNTQSIGNTHYLKKVQFVNENVGYILGLEGLGSHVFKTTDGGEHWTTLFSADFQDLYDMDVVSEDIIYVTFEEGTLKKSIDGGNSFQLVNSNLGVGKLQFFTELFGYASDGVTMAKTTDGGVTWTHIFPDVEPTFDEPIYHFYNENVGFVQWQNNLYRTTDAGASFNYLGTATTQIFKLYAPTENIVWGMSVEVPLSDSPIQTMRGEVLNDGSFEQTIGWPFLRSMDFVHPTLGYAIDGDVVYKNTTGLLSTRSATPKNKIKVYPNPASGFVYLQTQQPMHIQKILVLDDLGRVIYQNKLPVENNISIDVRAFARGCYWVVVESDEGRWVEKMVVE